MPNATVECFRPDHLYQTCDPELLTLAAEATLRHWRCRGGGPSFIKISPGPRGRIAYLGADLNSFLAERRVKRAA